MLNNSTQFLDSLFTQVRDLVGSRNEQPGTALEFTRIPNGFRVVRKSPFLAVERWFSENTVYGSAEPPTLFEPLTITGPNEASYPPDLLTKRPTVTVAEVAKGVLDFFDRPTPTKTNTGTLKSNK